MADLPERCDDGRVSSDMDQEIARRILLAYRFTPEELGVSLRLSWRDRVRIRITRRFDRVKAFALRRKVSDDGR